MHQVTIYDKIYKYSLHENYFLILPCVHFTGSFLGKTFNLYTKKVSVLRRRHFKGCPLYRDSTVLGPIHEFGLICMFVITSFRCTLNSYFLFVVLLMVLVLKVLVMSSECLWSSNSTVFFLLHLVHLVFLKTYLRETFLENVRGCHLQSVWTLLG